MGWAARSKIEERCKDIMDYVKAFVVGGIICAIVQILMEKTKLMPGRIMVMLVCTGALLWRCRHIRAIFKVGRRRCKRTAFGLWQMYRGRV